MTLQYQNFKRRAQNVAPAAQNASHFRGHSARLRLASGGGLATATGPTPAALAAEPTAAPAAAASRAAADAAPVPLLLCQQALEVEGLRLLEPQPGVLRAVLRDA